MSSQGQRLTKSAYENPQLVAGFVQRQAMKLKHLELLDFFLKLLPGPNVLDLGCGPGHESAYLASQNLHVIGLDYSNTMIATAKKLHPSLPNLSFQVGDMHHLRDCFKADQFDGIWANASLIHIEPDHISQVLAQMNFITKPSGIVMISVRVGSGVKIEKENKYGKISPIQFTYWQKDQLIETVLPLGWKLIHEKYIQTGTDTKNPIQRLMCIFFVPKH